MTDELSDFFDSHGATLHGLLLRLTLRHDAADDLFQELFLRLGAAAGFAGAENRLAYAKRAAINLALNWRGARQRRRDQASGGSDDDDGALRNVAAGDRPPLDGLIEAEQVERVLDASAELTELSRQAFVMRYVQQESFQAIADALGRTPHQARGLCHSAVLQIRDRLGDRSSTAGSEVAHG